MPANRPTLRPRPLTANRPQPKASPRIGNILPTPQQSRVSRLGSVPGRVNNVVGNWGAQHGMGGPSGRISQWQEGYERSLAYTQPGMRGLLSAMSGSFGGDIDPDTKAVVNLQAGMNLANRTRP